MASALGLPSRGILHVTLDDQIRPPLVHNPACELEVECLGLRVRGLRFGVEGLEIWVWGLGFRVRVKGSGFRVED